MLAKLVPAHRRQLRRVVAGELRNRQRRANERVLGTDEDLNRHPEPLERGKDGRRATKRIVEGRVHLPEARQRPNLSKQKIRLDAEPMLPGRRDGVVTEDERPAGRD